MTKFGQGNGNWSKTKDSLYFKKKVAFESGIEPFNKILETYFYKLKMVWR